MLEVQTSGVRVSFEIPKRRGCWVRTCEIDGEGFRSVRCPPSTRQCVSEARLDQSGACIVTHTSPLENHFSENGCAKDKHLPTGPLLVEPGPRLSCPRILPEWVSSWRGISPVWTECGCFAQTLWYHTSEARCDLEGAPWRLWSNFLRKLQRCTFCKTGLVAVWFHSWGGFCRSYSLYPKPLLPSCGTIRHVSLSPTGKIFAYHHGLRKLAYLPCRKDHRETRTISNKGSL